MPPKVTARLIEPMLRLRTDALLEWTGDSHLRHTELVALREDKSARHVRRE